VSVRAEFTMILQEMRQRVEVKTEINRGDPLVLKINFFHCNGGPMLKELHQIYNCLVYDNPSVSRFV